MIPQQVECRTKVREHSDVVFLLRGRYPPRLGFETGTDLSAEASFRIAQTRTTFGLRASSAVVKDAFSVPIFHPHHLSKPANRLLAQMPEAHNRAILT